MQSQVVIVVAVGLYVALIVGAAMWAGAAKRRDASRTRGRRRRGLRL